MIDLILFVLASYGLTSIVLYGSIFEGVRPDWELLECSMCLGFWVGILISFAIPLFPASFSGIILSGFVSSGTTYILDKLVGDSGININLVIANKSS